MYASNGLLRHSGPGRGDSRSGRGLDGMEPAVSYSIPPPERPHTWAELLVLVGAIRLRPPGDYRPHAPVNRRQGLHVCKSGTPTRPPRRLTCARKLWPRPVPGSPASFCRSVRVRLSPIRNRLTSATSPTLGGAQARRVRIATLSYLPVATMVSTPSSAVRLTKDTPRRDYQPASSKRQRAPRRDFVLLLASRDASRLVPGRRIPQIAKPAATKFLSGGSVGGGPTARRRADPLRTGSAAPSCVI